MISVLGVNISGSPLFQGKLELLTGATAANMKLELYNKENKLVCKMDNDSAMLGSFPVDDGMRLHVSFN